MNSECNVCVCVCVCCARCPSRHSTASMNAGGVRISITRADQYDAASESLQQSLDSLCHMSVSSPAEFGSSVPPAT